MSNAFNKALSFALRWEGGYSNHPNDRGGETNFGVTHAVYRAYRVSHRLPAAVGAID
jgi:lysozyme family protein